MRPAASILALAAVASLSAMTGCTADASGPAASPTDPRDGIPRFVASGDDTGGAETVEVLLRDAADAESIWEQMRRDATMPQNGDRGFVVTFWCSTLSGTRGDYVATGTAARGELGAQQTGLAAGTSTYVAEPSVVC
jgi:hypothetical protein